MNRLFLLLPLLGMFASCTPHYKIEGSSSVSSLDGRMLYLKTLTDGAWVTVDSTEVLHGLFSMKGVVDSVMMVTLYMDEESIMPLVLEKGEINVSISHTELKASGTKLNDAFYTFVDQKNAMDLKIAELERKEARMVMDGADLEEIHEQLLQEGRLLVDQMNDYVLRFISENYENVLGPSVFMMLCSNLPYPILTPEIETILKDAPASFKSHPIVKEFITKAKENQQLIEEHERMNGY